jgi:hypothetical protein
LPDAVGVGAELLLEAAELGAEEPEDRLSDGVPPLGVVALELGAAAVEVPAVVPVVLPVVVAAVVPVAVFDAFEEQAVALSATRVPPARKVMRCSRFMFS